MLGVDMREECIAQWNQEVNDWIAYVEQRKAELEKEDISDSILGKKLDYIDKYEHCIK